MQVGILITDGYSDDADEVIAVSDEVKAAGISMFVIGIGSSLNDAELAAVASDPDSDYLFYHGFEDLSGFVDQMSTTSCNGKVSSFIDKLFLRHLPFTFLLL